ncbi:hypothetical protein L5515_011443 [Caenorhabditis briggsae]|uniref:G-protein coupled receptors family 1 profile domain-containing protein n=1 Tax=Caenorhabditis briggsae TaxID=6238 RepID=A0AAE9EU96_CAEBR|nr:hypothetical protein L5515_011443 [Caenorhabditis briggsae]
MEGRNCVTVQEYQPEYNDMNEIRAIFSVLYLIVWVAAIVGNTLVLYVLTFNQVSLSVRTVFVGCLAGSDLLMCLFSLPITAISIFSRVWVFPSIFCKLIGVFQGGTIFVSSFTLTVIALDRCVLILRPNQEIVNFPRAVFIVFCIWLLGYCLALPVGIYSNITVYEEICGTFCEENWPDFNQDTGRSGIRRAYGLSVLVLQFGIPAFISSICYWMISQVMSSQLERRRGHNIRPESEEKLVNRKNRANRMMIVMVVGFVLAWMPFNAVNLYRDLFGISTTKWYSTVFALCHVCAMCSAVLNPIIYSWFNPQFRTSITTLFKGNNDEARLIKKKPSSTSKMVAYPNNLSEVRKDTEIQSNKTKISIAENDYRAGDQLL